MSNRTIRICGWSCLAFLTLFACGWVGISNFIPPMAPTAPAAEVARFYADNAMRIQLGFVVTMFSVAFTVPFVAGMTGLLRKIDGPESVYALCFLIIGSAATALFYILVTVWATAAFRPERAPEITQALNDFGWLMMVWLVSVLLPLFVPPGLVALRDRSPNPLLPRWYGYFCLSDVVITLAGALSNFFKTGPFAYDGVIAFWVAVGFFFIWYVVTAVLMARLPADGRALAGA